MKDRALIALVTAATLLQLAACTTSRIEQTPWPMFDSTTELPPLAIDGLWQVSSESQPAKYRLDGGRMYLHSDFDSEGRFGMLRYRMIEQTGPRSFACEKLIRSHGQNRWVRCRLSLEVDGSLIEESASLPELGIEASASLFKPVEPDDPTWFRAQRRSPELVSKTEAHRPSAPAHPPYPAAIELPVLPPPPPPTEIIQSTPKPKSPGGLYHALVIGTGDYLYLPAVATAEGDADAVASLLEERYRFQVTNLRNPGRQELLNALTKLQQELSPRDNLLVYYSGHGWLSELDGRCYWFPVDALENDSSTWIANREITQRLKVMEARNIIVVVDSCYTDGQRREGGLSEDDPDPPTTTSDERTRVVLSAGSLEPVQTGDGGQHSAFTHALLEVLRGNQGVLDGASLYAQIREILSPGAIQTPEYADLTEAEHDGGDFRFVAVP